MECIDIHRFLVDVLQMNLLQKNVHYNQDILNRRGFVANVPKNKIIFICSNFVLLFEEKILDNLYMIHSMNKNNIQF